MEPSAIQLFVLDGDPLLGERVVARLDARPDLRVNVVPDSSEPALRLIDDSRPRVALLHAAAVCEPGSRLIERVRESAPDVRIIVMDLLPGQQGVAELVKAGAFGFVMQDATTEELIQAILSVAAGEVVLPFELTGTLLTQIADWACDPPTAPEVLRAERMTKREREVVELLAEGLSNKEIGRRLHVGTPTVKSHVHSILDKLALGTRLQIASFGWGEREAAERRAGVA